jgi:GNAT superfamily N-acetyltransferase
MTIAYRPAVQEDEPWLFQLHEDAHRQLVETAYGPWVVEQQQGFFRALVDDHQVLVIESGDEPIGALYLGEREGDTWLELIEVTPSWQGRGVGGGALRWVRDAAATAGRGVLLQVHRVNERARRLYLREGFIEISETETHHVLRSTPAT